ncbi:MAG: hypothetical protein K2M04_01940 [Muribaculaceae bacterium]|nr:hypothetical protein [Muribaculaceae bacterium]
MRNVKFLMCTIIAVATNFSSNAVEPGYRGFVDYGYMIGTGDFDGSSLNEISTTHGYQILPQLFVGAGVGVHLYKFNDAGSDLHYNLPIYADVRWDILDETKFTPFIDFKGGYSVAGEFTGMYINPSIGCRMALGDKLGLNLGVGYTYMKTGYEFIYNHEDLNMTGINIRLGLDF